MKDGRVGRGPGHGLTDLPSSMASLTQTQESFLEEAKLGAGGGWGWWQGGTTNPGGTVGGWDKPPGVGRASTTSEAMGKSLTLS